MRLIPHEEIWYAEGRALYWKGRIFQKQDKPDEARARLREGDPRVTRCRYTRCCRSAACAKARPRKAVALMRELRGGASDRPAKWSFAPRAIFGEPGFVRAVELARMGQGGDARRELARLGLVDRGREARVGARQGGGRKICCGSRPILLDRGGVWSASSSIPRYIAMSYRLSYPKALGEAKWKISYPRAFPALGREVTPRANQNPRGPAAGDHARGERLYPRIESFANANRADPRC